MIITYISLRELYASGGKLLTHITLFIPTTFKFKEF